jgi:hypothetical protein
MHGRHIVLAALVAAVTLASVASAGPAAAQQRVSITSKGFGTPSGQFVFTPLQAGALKARLGHRQLCLQQTLRDTRGAERRDRERCHHERRQAREVRDPTPGRVGRPWERIPGRLRDLDVRPRDRPVRTGHRARTERLGLRKERRMAGTCRGLARASVTRWAIRRMAGEFARGPASRQATGLGLARI